MRWITVQNEKKSKILFLRYWLDNRSYIEKKLVIGPGASNSNDFYKPHLKILEGQLAS
jgi:hypothetical protein